MHCAFNRNQSNVIESDASSWLVRSGLARRTHGQSDSTVAAGQKGTNQRRTQMNDSLHHEEHASSMTAPELALIPQPVHVSRTEGSFVIDERTVVAAAGDAVAGARKLIEALSPAIGFELQLVDDAVDVHPPDGVIRFRLGDPVTTMADTAEDGFAVEGGPRSRSLASEGYRLEVTPERIDLEAPGLAGLHNGVQTIRQLLPAGVFASEPAAGVRWTVPCVSISDRPRFGWRGLMLDTVRHFLAVDDILTFIDWMALHKLNRLHLHLTDDQGWRIEIRKHPLLTEVGAWRDETLIGHAGSSPKRYDGRRHGGYYTQDDIRRIVSHAAGRHITVVPEIEMPGHARAAIAAYPHLGVFPDEQRGLRPWTEWGISEQIFSLRRETIAFLQDVLLEVMELFPGEFIHIGGDEAIKDHWRRSAEVQAQIRDLGLADEDELQSWFIRQMDAFLTSHGRRLIGWDEILEGGLAPGAAVMSWRGEEGGIAAARAGHDAVMAPARPLYLDHYQGPEETEPLAIGGLNTLEDLHRYEPVPGVMSGTEARRVLGAQAQLWSEYIPSFRHMQYMAFPRACAFAEVVWSGRDRPGYADFERRLRVHTGRLDALGIAYRGV